MGADKMASEERLKEDAAMREANEKQIVLTEETGPRLRKTHKGEEFVGGDDAPLSDEFRAPPRREREDIPESKSGVPQSPRGEGQAVVELPEDMGQRAPLAVDTSGTPMDGVRRQSSFDINSVFDKVRSPQAEQQAFLQRRQSSIRPPQETPRQGPGDDADIDRLLKDEDQDTHMTGTEPGIVWQGTLQMQQMNPIEATARFVAGGDFGQVLPWTKLLPSVLPIKGRIEKQKGDEYIRSLAITGSHDVCVLALTPTTADSQNIMSHVYEYFHPRDRWGVVPVTTVENDTVRDLYVVPLEPGGGDLPPFLDMLEYCTIETPRKDPMMLLALIAKLPDTKPGAEVNPFESHAAQSTPSGPGLFNGPPNGASPSPLTNPHGPQYSPMAPNFPPNQTFDNGNPSNPHFQHAQLPPNNGYVHTQPGAQMHHAYSPTPPAPFAPLAIKILGAYLTAPVIARILASSEGGATMTEEQMTNLKHIMDTVPDAQKDFGVFQKHLATSFQPVQSQPQ